MISYLVFCVTAYLLGSIPTAVWLGKAKYGIDVREHGSKNAGATNTFRVLGKKPGIVVLTIDILKGSLAVGLPYFLWDIIYPDKAGMSDQAEVLAALSAVFGHLFPVFANFKGGKGVATSFGVILAINPIAASACAIAFLLVFLLSSYVSLGALAASVTFPMMVIVVLKSESVWFNSFALILSLAVIIKHRKNIIRLVHGEENKMNLFKK